MHITLTPQRRDDGPLALFRKGDTLTINDTAFDFALLPEGAILPRSAVDCPLLASNVTRHGGSVHLTLILPLGARHGPDASNPAPIIDPPDGPVTLPMTHLPEDEE